MFLIRVTARAVTNLWGQWRERNYMLFKRRREWPEGLFCLFKTNYPRWLRWNPSPVPSLWNKNLVFLWNTKFATGTDLVCLLPGKQVWRALCPVKGKQDFRRPRGRFLWCVYDEFLHIVFVLWYLKRWNTLIWVWIMYQMRHNDKKRMY